MEPPNQPQESAAQEVKAPGPEQPLPNGAQAHSATIGIPLPEALAGRVQYANGILALFEELRMRALNAKVPMPYQKRWQYDSNLFFKMAVNAKTRLDKVKS